MVSARIRVTQPEIRPAFFSKSRGTIATGNRVGRSSAPRLLACIDDSPASAAVLPHARALAPALGLSLTLGRVIETPRLHSPADPIEWKIRRDRHRANLIELAGRNADGEAMAGVLLSGSPADELSIWGRENGASVLALSRRSWPSGGGLGSTAQRLLESSTASLLLVPGESPQFTPYRRVLVPIDGSARSESVLPVAARIARMHDAEILLVHVVPQLEIVDEARIPQLRELHVQINAHNERNARDHLETLRARLAGDGLAARTIVTGPGDPRAVIRRIADQEQADLIVLSSHGRTGLADACCGSVAEYLAVHASSPLLLVRPNLMCRFDRPSGASRDLAGAHNR